MENDFLLREAGNKYLFLDDMNFGPKKVKFRIHAGFPVLMGNSLLLSSV